MSQRNINDLTDDERLLELYDYWLSKREGRRLPSREDIDPGEISHLLPHLMLVDVLEGGEQFRLRLIGAALIDATGVDATGKFLSDVIPEGAYADYVSGLFREAIEARQPIYAACEHSDPERVSHGTIRLIMPLSDDDEAVNMALVGQIFETDEVGASLRPSDEQGAFEPSVQALLT